jgi:RNA polymerase sigma-70 factor (ECF subfamily)
VQFADETWLYLAALGRCLLRYELVGKVDLSGVVQQTLLDAHLAGLTLSTPDPTRQRAWLTQVFERNLTDAVRRATAARRDATREVSLAGPAGPDEFPLAGLLAADGSSPSGRASREEEVARLARALIRLPIDQRRAVELRYLHDRSVGEIADALGRSKAAVAGLLKRGLRQLRELLADTDPARG